MNQLHTEQRIYIVDFSNTPLNKLDKKFEEALNLVINRAKMCLGIAALDVTHNTTFDIGGSVTEFIRVDNNTFVGYINCSRIGKHCYKFTIFLVEYY